MELQAESLRTQAQDEVRRIESEMRAQVKAHLEEREQALRAEMTAGLAEQERARVDAELVQRRRAADERAVKDAEARRIALPDELRAERLVPATPVEHNLSPEAAKPSGRRRGLLALGVIAAVSGIVVAAVLLVAKPFSPERDPATVGLVRRVYPSLGFDISVPRSWKDAPTTVGGARGIAFTDSGKDAARDGFRVLAMTTSLQEAQAAVVAEIRRPPGDKDPIAINEGLRVGGRRAFRYTFGSGSSYIQQWWVERPGGTLLLQMWTPVASQREASVLSDRVVETLHVI
jgi:hypothetical protein